MSVCLSVCACVSVSMCVCVFVYMCVRMYVCVCVCGDWGVERNCSSVCVVGGELGQPGLISTYIRI